MRPSPGQRSLAGCADILAQKRDKKYKRSCFGARRRNVVKTVRGRKTRPIQGDSGYCIPGAGYKGKGGGHTLGHIVTGVR